MKTLFVVCIVTCLFLSSNALDLYHRLWNPAHKPPPFMVRGQLRINEDLSLVFVDSSGFDAVVSNFDFSDDTLYQVALERDGDSSEKDWDISSVKACHLRTSHSDIIKVHLSPGAKPYALDYYLSPISHNGQCSPMISARRFAITNTTVLAETSGSPPVPELRTPPPLSPTGQPVQPPPEKSFLQKYGLYIGLAVLVLSLTGGPPAEEGQGGQRGR